uniref:Signal peptide protein n=1 Tax=Heterorhabditis bacteriophora TaxID=37862 RepID=A0A1I7W6V7_HETBA
MQAYKSGDPGILGQAVATFTQEDLVSNIKQLIGI